MRKIDSIRIVPVETLIHGMDVSGLKSADEIGAGKTRIWDDLDSVGDQRRHTLLYGDWKREIGRHNLIDTPAEEVLRGGTCAFGHAQTIEKLASRVEKYKNQIVVDLGAGSEATSYRISRDAGAKAYVAVEPHFADVLYQTLLENILEDEKQGTAVPKVSIIDEGMLEVLKRLPEQSVSLLMTGIDDTVIKFWDRYFISHELARVIHPNGCYVLDCGSIGPHMREDEWKRFGEPKSRFPPYLQATGRGDKTGEYRISIITRR